MIDSLIFATLALLSAAIDRNINAIPYLRLFTEILRLIPVLGLFSFVIYKLTKKPLKMIFTSVKQKLNDHYLLVAMDIRMTELKMKKRETMRIITMKISFLIDLCILNSMMHKKINQLTSSGVAS